MSQSVSALPFVFTAVSLVLSVGVPIVLAVLCARRGRSALRAVLTGAIFFFAAAMVLEPILHQVVFRLFPNLPQNPLAYTVYGALAAGVFEETARLIGLRRLCKKDASPLTGFAYGVGHGGFEAIMLGAFGQVQNLIIFTTINSGGLDTLLASVPEAQRELARAQLEAVSSTPAVNFLAGGVERMGAIVVHIALSMVVWMAVTGRLPRWGYPLAILLHALLDVPAALYQCGVITSLWVIEVLLLAFAALLALGVRQLYRSRPAPAV